MESESLDIEIQKELPNLVNRYKSRSVFSKKYQKTLANKDAEVVLPSCNVDHTQLNSSVIGNILGESSTNTNVSIVDDGASETTTSNVEATAMSLSAGGRDPDRLGDTDRRLPLATVANGPPIRRKTGTIAVPVVDLPPVLQTNEQPPNVSNPFTSNGNENRISSKRFWPDNLIQLARELVNSPSIEPAAPEFSFLMNQESAHKNLCVLKKYDYKLESALEAQKDSPLSYGSEFKATEILEPIFSRHPNWNRMKLILQNGSCWPMEDLPLQEKSNDLQEALAFGNHKGATSNPEVLRDLVKKDVTFGYGLVLPLDKLDRVPGALLAPMNIMRQNTIDEHGRTIEKDRLTHDQSYKWGSGTSVNSRVNKDLLLPCKFGACLKRLMNWTVAARIKYPNKRILASKIDYKSAYRRCHLNAKVAVQTCTQLPEENLAIMALRLTFGGCACPFEWGAISESICDLAMAFLHSNDWDPTSLKSKLGDMVPKTKFLPDDVPFAKGKDLIIDVPVDPRGTADVYIDDTISLCVDMEGSSNVEKLRQCSLLAINVASRDVHENEPIPRVEMAEKKKLLAEAGPEEVKTILGWVFNFRKLTVSLPANKYVAWSNSIKDLLTANKTSFKELESLIGRMVHVGIILPQLHHFMSRLRDLLWKSSNRRSINLTESTRKDLELMLFFLNKAKDGIDMNLLVFRKPTKVYRSDSCPAGMGGYSSDGFAWRWYLPDHLKFRASNNLLEHLAAIITPWIDMITARLKKGDCFLSMTDSSTSEGWLKISNFSELGEDPIQAEVRIEVCRSDAKRKLEFEVKDYSQWFPGDHNDVSDALSRDDDRSDEELIRLLYKFCPSQMPSHFKIVPLPAEIVSFLTSILQKLPVKTQFKERHTRTKIGRGPDGLNTVNPSVLKTTSTLTTFQDIKETNSWGLLPWLCVKGGFQENLMVPWLRVQSEVPFHLYLRPSGIMEKPIQQKTRMGTLQEFYQDSTEPSETRTQIQSNKKPSPLKF